MRRSLFFLLATTMACGVSLLAQAFSTLPAGSASQVSVAGEGVMYPLNGAWNARAVFPSNIIRGVGVYYPPNGKFYVMGGRISDSAGSDLTNPVEYTPGTNSWATKAATYPDNQVNNMACGVVNFNFTTPQVRIVCVGGSAAGSVSATARVFVYDPVADSIAALTAPDNWPATPSGTILPGGFAVHNNLLYIVGGFDINVAMSDQVWAFNPTAAIGSRWTARANYPVARGYVPTAAINGQIYTAGGGNGDSAFVDSTDSYKYDPVSNSWSPITPIPRATGETRAVAIGGKMWVLGGGRTAPNPSSEVNIYDPSTNAWTLGPAMNLNRRNFPADAKGADRGVFVAGGYAGGGTGTPTDATEVYNQGVVGTGGGAIGQGSTCFTSGTPSTSLFAVSGVKAPLGNVEVALDIAHTFIGDLDVVLAAPGGSPSLVLFSRVGVTSVTTGCAGDSSNLDGSYTFSDNASGSIWNPATAAACTSNCVIAAGLYRTSEAGSISQPNPPPLTSLTATFNGLTPAQINGTWTLTVRDGNAGDLGTVTAATLLLTPKALFDTDRDGETDRTVYRSSNNVWYTAKSNGGASATGWGAANDVDVMGDYDGDGKADIAIWRPSNGNWFIVQSGTGAVRVDVWGQSGDIPLAGDVDGDGKDDLVIFRPTAGAWFFKRSGGGTPVLGWGLNGDIPLLGDFDGDGKVDAVAYRPSSGVWYINQSGGGTPFVGWGTPGDIPVIGDWDGDKKSDPAIFRPNTGTWFVKNSGGGTTVVSWGSSGDVPVSGDMDGDLKSDFNIYRTGIWFSQLSGGGVAAVGWGIAGDKPVGRVPGS